MKVRKRIILFCVGAAFIAVAILFWSRDLDTPFVPKWGGDYAGNIPELGLVHALLGGSASEPTLSLDNAGDRTMDRWWAPASNRAGGLVFTAETEGATMRIELSPPGAVLKGMFQATNQLRKPFELKLVTGTLGYHRVSGLSIDGRGTSQTWDAQIPELTNGPFERALTDWLKLNTSQREAADREDFKPTLEERWEAWHTKSVMWHWDSDLRWRLIYRSQNVASLLGYHYRYSGGAHGNTEIETANFRWANGHAQRIRLRDLFRPGVDWQSRLTNIIMTDLKAQEASWPTAAPIHRAMALEMFTLDDKGLTFHFEPYEVGSYAEGIRTVLVRWETLAPYLSKTVVHP